MVVTLINFSSKEMFLIIIKLSTKVIILLEQVFIFNFERAPTLSKINIIYNLNGIPTLLNIKMNNIK